MNKGEGAVSFRSWFCSLAIYYIPLSFRGLQEKLPDADGAGEFFSPPADGGPATLVYPLVFL